MTCFRFSRFTFQSKLSGSPPASRNSKGKERRMKSSKLLVAVIVLNSLILISQWTGSSPVTPAYGQIPDAGGQRQQIIDELKTLNGKMDRMTDSLKSGEVQVKVAKPDEKK